MSEYRMHRAGFDRKSACRGQFNTVPDIEDVDSDDGVDYVDWGMIGNADFRTVNYTYRMIDGEPVKFRNGERY